LLRLQLRLEHCSAVAEPFSGIQKRYACIYLTLAAAVGHRSVVQFAYGEDGIDVTQRSFLREFGFLARNAERFAQQVDPAGAERASRLAGLQPLEQEALRRNRCRSMLIITCSTESWV